jgi:hypothetical protein
MKTSTHRAILVAFLLALLPYALMVYRFNYVCDDAFISFRYSKHLAMGEGLRFNLDAPPVEGFSNFLWVLVLTPFEAAGSSAALWSRVLSIACGVLLLWRLTRFLAVHLHLPPILLVLASTFFATLPPVAVWSTGGLATLPLTLMLFVAFELYLQARDSVSGLMAGLAGSVLILLRAEGFIWAGLLFLIFGIRSLSLEKRTIRPILLAGLVSGMTWIILTAFRLWYFGSLLPNTAYAKVGLSSMTLERGGKYLLSFVLTFPLVGMILIVGAWVAWKLRSTSRIVFPAASLALFIWMYSVLVGGDFMAMGRFFVPSLPFLAILFGEMSREWTERWPVPVVVLIGGITIALTILPGFSLHLVPEVMREKVNFRWHIKSFRSEYDHWRVEKNVAENWSDLGRALGRHTSPDESLVTLPIGAIGYYSDLFIFDQAGLVDPEVARAPRRRRSSPGHDKTQGKVKFLKYDPTYIHAFLAKGLDGVYLDHVIDTPHRKWSERVRSLYAPVTIPVDSMAEGDSTPILVLWKRKDLLN